MEFLEYLPHQDQNSRISILGRIVNISKSSQCMIYTKHSENLTSLKGLINNVSKERTTPPSHVWHRPSGQTIGKTLDW